MVLSIFLALLVSGAGYWWRALDFSGFLAATFVGTSIFWGAGLAGASVLIFFFVLGSVLSRLPSGVTLSEQKARRDWRQVLANGFWPAALALGYGLNRNETYYLALVGALAVACADTVGGEVGIRRGRRTVSLRGFRLIPPGQSGGVSLIGTVSGGVSAALLGLVGIFPKGWGLALSLELVAMIAVIGFLGSLFDSILGAWLQGKFKCTVCRTGVEVQVHCGKRAERIAGLEFLDNDGVNFLATFFGGVMGLFIF
jgi:uncharacterized protein (TIGR00297 family)